MFRLVLYVTTPLPPFGINLLRLWEGHRMSPWGLLPICGFVLGGIRDGAGLEPIRVVNVREAKVRSIAENGTLILSITTELGVTCISDVAFHCKLVPSP